MTEKAPKVGLLQQFNLTPPMLQKRIVVNVGMAFLIAAVSIILAVVSKSQGLLVGVLIAAYIGYLGIDILVGWRNGTIRNEKMVIVKSSRVLLTKKVNLILREVDETEGDGKRHEAHIEVSRDDINMLTTGTVLNVCFREEGVMEVLAWEIYA